MNIAIIHVQIKTNIFLAMSFWPNGNFEIEKSENIRECQDFCVISKPIKNNCEQLL